MNTLRIVAILIAVSIGLASCGSPPNTLTAAPRLASMDNFRDIAGPDAGYATAYGKRVEHGVVFRSNAITPNDTDLATLNSLGITAIYDLRTSAEVAAVPDTALADAKNVRVNIVGDSSDGDLATAVASMTTPAQAADLLATMNRQFVTDAGQRAELKTLLTDIADGSSPQIVHCTAGKDRTGWATALLLSVAGVPRETIIDDYLLTNEYSRASIDAKTAQVAQAQGADKAAVIKVLLSVAPEYLQAGFDEADRTYGSIDNYLTAGLGLSPDTIAGLKDKLTR